MWKLSTDAGSSLDAGDLVRVLATHQQRVLEGWHGFTGEQWEHPSRNPGWSVHDTARHVADALESCTAAVWAEPSPFGIADFDARTTPDVWLAQSAHDPPARTIERYAAAAERMRARVGERVAADDPSMARTVYGTAHWSLNVVHILWDSWLHERDIALPLDRPAESSLDEQRLVALYGLLMAMVPSRMMEMSLETTVDFGRTTGHCVAASQDGGRIVTTETDDASGALVGDLAAVVDALAGRGAPVADVLPGAPDELGLLAAYLAG